MACKNVLSKPVISRMKILLMLSEKKKNSLRVFIKISSTHKIMKSLVLEMIQKYLILPFNEHPNIKFF